MGIVFFTKDWFLGIQIDITGYIERCYVSKFGLRRPIISEAKMLRNSFIYEES